MRLPWELGSFGLRKDFGDVGREVVKAFGVFEAELAFGVHFEDAGFCEANETRLRPRGISAAFRGTGVDADLTGGKKIRDGVEAINDPLFILRHKSVSAKSPGS